MPRRLLTHLPGAASGTCFAGSHFPWSPPFAPPPPLQLAPPQIAPQRAVPPFGVPDRVLNVLVPEVARLRDLLFGTTRASGALRSRINPSLNQFAVCHPAHSEHRAPSALGQRRVPGFSRNLLGTGPLASMWRLGSTHCPNRGEGGSQIQVVDGAALEEISGECFAAAKRNIDKVHPK
jgi:hypothetical protein